MANPVNAHYVPKTVTYRASGDAIEVRIKAPSPKRVAQGLALILLAFFVPPFFAFKGLGLAGLIFVGMIGAGLYLLFSGSPAMRISAAGVEVEGRLFRAEDASHFTDYADDDWTKQFLKFAKADTLGLKYGIYAVSMPYALSLVELPKVALFLTDLLKAQSPHLEAERERKIQQAQSF